MLKVSSSGFWVWGEEFGVQGLGLGFGVWGLGFGIQGLGLRVWGVKFERSESAGAGERRF